MRTVSPAFSRSNQGGPFSPIIIGDSVGISSDSFIFTDGSNLGTKKIVTMPPALVKTGLKVYLVVNFKDGVFESMKIESGSSWWSEYPNTIKYNGNQRIISKQTALYTPIFSVPSVGFSGAYAQTSEGNLTVYRHVYNNLIIMQTCKYFFFLPAPAAPGLESS